MCHTHISNASIKCDTHFPLFWVKQWAVLPNDNSRHFFNSVIVDMWVNVDFILLSTNYICTINNMLSDSINAYVYLQSERPHRHKYNPHNSQSLSIKGHSSLWVLSLFFSLANELEKDRYFGLVGSLHPCDIYGPRKVQLPNYVFVSFQYSWKHTIQKNEWCIFMHLLSTSPRWRYMFHCMVGCGFLFAGSWFSIVACMG